MYKKLLPVTLLFLVLAQTSPSYAQVSSFAKCSSGSYKNVSGKCVHSPVKAPSWPSGASAECRDGSYSYSQHRSGTCSHHGGVLTWHA